MGKERSYFYNVHDDVPEEFAPLMAAYMSYYKRTSNLSASNSSNQLKICEPMIFRLLTFLYEFTIDDEKRIRRKNKEQRRQMIIDKVTDDGGELMTPHEQINFFADFVCEKLGEDIVVFLFKENDPTPIHRTEDDRSGEINIPVIKWNNGKYAASSMDNIFCKEKYKFCYSCNKEYSDEIQHINSCKNRCRNCMRMGYNMPCKKTIDWNDRIKCPDCKIQFQSHDCFEAHKHRACKHRKVCGKCFKLYNAIKNVHVCGHFYCRECKSSHPKNSKAKGEFHCYIQKAKINKKTDFAPILKIYYDFETVQTLKLIVTKKRPYPNFDNLNSSNETFETPYLDDVTDAHPHHNEHADHHNIQSNPRIRFEVNNDENGFSRIRDTIELEDEFFNVVNNETSTLTNKNVHQVNTASCLVKCSKCFYETNLTLGCDLCNLNKIITWTSVPNAKPGVFFCDENEDQYPVNLFRDFIIDLSNKQPFTKIILYAHNSSRFDGHLLNRSFVKLGYAPQTIYRGFSIIQSIFKANGSIGCNIFLRDTIKLAPISLAKFAECFGIEDGIAKFEMFPYLLNEPKNYLSKLNMLPAKKYYGYDLMTTKKRAEFDQKYEEENIKMLLENRQFVFVDEIIKYVEMDVITLYRGMMEYSKILNDVVKPELEKYRNETLPRNHDFSYFSVDEKGCTLASLGMYIFRLAFLEENVLAHIQETGYSHLSNQSKIAIKYLDWIAHSENKQILHRDNSATGEVVMDTFYKINVDGMDVANYEIYEINGCRFHGCDLCYKHTSTVLFDGLTVGDVRERDRIRMERLKKVFDGKIHIVRECEIYKMLEEDKKTMEKPMNTFFDKCFDTSPIDLRHALAGGRCGPSNLEYKREEGVTEIKHFDANSLYPFAMFTTEMPIGHAVVKTCQQPYRHHSQVPIGIIKARVLCPQNMRFPILPVKHKSQMILPICRTCMEKYDLTTNQTKESCNHSMDERSFVWEGTHIELKYAMMKNYLVLDVYHVLEYEKTSKNLFRNYLKVFIAMKVHASVPPENFEDPRVRQSFVDEYKNLYDIDINPNECKFNAAKRYIAKIFNNCLWGRLCLNATGTEKQCITTEEYVDYARDETINALTAIEIEKDVLLINYKKDSNFITTTHTNLVAACYVTAAGRLHLQKFIFKIIAAGGKILYMDTDSIIFVQPRGANILGAGGRILGEFVDEHGRQEIISYISSGPKSYQLELKEIGQDSTTLETKLKGFSNCKNVEDALKPSAFKYNPAVTIPIELTKIGPTYDFQITTSKIIKKFTTKCVKGIIDMDTYDVLPFGWIFELDDCPIVLGPEDDTNVEAILRG